MTLRLSDNNHPPARKRARIACELCHERKVRCDFSSVGSPCTNCHLDHHDCFVRKTSTKRPKKRLHNQRLGSPPALADFPLSELLPEGEEETVLVPASLSVQFRTDKMYQLFSDLSVNSFRNEDYLLPVLSPSSTLLPKKDGPSQSFTQDLHFNTSVVFCYYRFLRLEGLSRVSPDDVRYLESKGCLHVPSRPHLDYFIRSYFLHVHPCMPVVDEGQFWDMYSNVANSESDSPGISLLVFQAMLFAACTFVPLTELRACGFQNFYAARETLYQRARLLYTLQPNTGYSEITQASLLLSFQSTPYNPMSNTSWLSTAIQYARADNAHLYYCLPDLTYSQRKEKKRLWWCCVVRDRVIALGVRRHLQITLDHFDFQQETITERDFKEEMETSRVYDLKAKRQLVRIFIAQCELAVALTSTIMTIYPLNGFTNTAGSSVSWMSTMKNRIENNRRELVEWEENTKEQLSSNFDETVGPHNSGTLYADLTYIYYFSARIALCQYSIYICHINVGDNAERLKTDQNDLERGIIKVTDKVTNLVSLGLIGHLPISVIAYTALPLALLSLDVKFSLTESQKERRENRLGVYVEAMNHYGLRFNFVRVVSEIVHKLLRFIDANEPSSHLNQNSASITTRQRMSSLLTGRPRSWVELLTKQPQLFSKLSFSLDLALSRGRYPAGSELPDWTINLSTPQVASEQVEQTCSPRNIAMLGSQEAPVGDMSLWREGLLQQHHPMQAVPPSLRVSEVGSFEERNGIDFVPNESMDKPAEHHEGDNYDKHFEYNMLTSFFDFPPIGG
ncbi:fungal-specific transcription factor domain-containing protein [Bisporella sp. PMI_857]|nr:fungal-specific transcription factor domain-containing protein [Bisporella sp. PMI_857]